MKIDVQEAEVKTASVEIQTLTVSGKQVTLAVFRQMERDTPIELDEGTWWGRVNYHPDNCAKQRNHVHFVWEDEGELRRAHLTYPKRADFWDYPEDRRDSAVAHDLELWKKAMHLPQLFIAV